MSARITKAMVEAAAKAAFAKANEPHLSPEKIEALWPSQHRPHWDGIARACLAAALSTEGMVLVPREPTPDMLVAAGTIEGWNEAASKHADECHIAWWKAMLAAAPLPEGTHHGR